VVRGLAALLVATAYVLGAGLLPEAGAYVPAVCGAIAIGLCATAPLAGRDDPVALAILGAGAVLLAVALNAQDVVSEVTPVEALFAACAGLLFAFGFAVPAAVVALPILVAGIDAASLLGGAEPVTQRGGSDLLTLALPAWGDGPTGSIPAPGLLNATFLALFAGWALRYDLRPRIAIAAMVAGLAASLVLALALDRSIPTLPFLAVGFLGPSIRRIGHVLRSEG
jgi:hypothetical protein